MHKGLLLLVEMLLFLPALSLATPASRGLTVVAKDSATNQSGEVKLYNRSYAVIIGIDRYKSLPPDRQLKNAVRDASGVEAVLKKNFRFDRVITLFNEQATKDRILEVLTEELPAQMNDQDSLFLFWAGHGDQETGAQGKEIGYLIPFDGEVGKIRKNLTMTELRDTISAKLPAKHVFYVMDACYGGLLASTRAVDKKNRRDLAYLKEITRENVRQVLTAGGKGEEVLDGGPKGHSVFTGRLIEALEAAGDFITANEIQAIIREKVYGDSRSQGKTQTPAFGTLSGSGDFVFIPNIEEKLKDNRAELARMEAELKKLEAREQEARKQQSAQQQREAEQKRKAAEARLKAEQLRQQQLAEESKRQQEMATDRARFEAEQKKKEQELATARQAEEQRVAALKAELARMKQTVTATGTGATLQGAVAEIRRLGSEIKSIEAAFSRELSAGTTRITQRYNAEIAEVRMKSKLKQASPVKDEFETEAEYRARVAKQGSSWGDRITTLEQQKQVELTALEKRLAQEQQNQTSDLRQQIILLSEKQYTVGAETVAVELGNYNPEKQQFPVVLKSREAGIPVAVNGIIPMPRDAARSFKQQWQAGAVRPQVKLVAGNFAVASAAIVNDADNSIYGYLNGEFITVAERKVKEEERRVVGEFVSVPAGCFLDVCLDAFRIAKYEVTQAQWKAVMGSNPSSFSSCGDNCPVEQVSWYDVQLFIKKLNSISARKYRLPTEAEWEYACRAGQNYEYCGSNDINAVAWYKDNSDGQPHPVGQKQPNAWGIHDMSGNVWEWVQDYFGIIYPTETKNPTGAPWGESIVKRGGSWNSKAPHARAALRDHANPGSSPNITGFRLAAPVQ